MEITNKNIYLGSISNKEERNYVIYQKEENKKIDFFNGIEYHEELKEGPNISYLMEYYKTKTNANVQTKLLYLDLFIKETIKKILTNFGNMTLDYFECKDAFYEANRAGDFIEETAKVYKKM